MKKTGTLLLFILLFGVIIRILFIFFTPNRIIQGDTAVYQNIAKDILSGHGLRGSLSHPPVYSLFLSGLYLIFGDNIKLISVVQSALSSIIIFLIFILARKVFKDDKVAIVSSFIVAVDPFLIYFGGSTTSEILFTIFLLMALLLLVYSFDLSSKKYIWFLAGIMCGITLLTRAAILGFIFLIPAILLIYRSFKIYFLHIVFIFSGLIFILSPWIYRNYNVSGKFVLATSQAGWNMWEAMNPKPYSQEACHKWIENMNTETKSMDEFQKDKYFREKLANYVKRNPVDFFISTIKKFFRFWRFYPYDPYPLKYKIISVAFYGPLMLLAIIGIVYTLPLYKNTGILYLLLIYTCISAFMFCPAIRYRLHINPVLAVFAAYSLIILQK